MTKVPCTTAGIQQLASSLYALPDTQRAIEAQAVKDDFIGWVNGKVALTERQLNWLDTIDNLYIDYLGIKTAIAINSKLPMNITFPPVVPPGGDNGKWIMDKETIQTVWSGPGIITATGALEVEFGYTP